MKRRVIFIVLDSVGLIEAPDAAKFGDQGSSTLGHLYSYRQKQNRDFAIPNLSAMGVDDLFFRHGISKQSPSHQHIASWGTLEEISAGKDTSSGHWEFAGIPQPKAFPIFPNGFSQDLLDLWCKQNNLPGVLGNKVGSGTEIIAELGEEHMRTGKPIVYTSSDSVFQVAAHEQSFGLQKLRTICESARQLLTPLNVGRVIARPFIGSHSRDFTRTENRKDYSVTPDYPNLLDVLSESKHFVYGIGKIDDIFCYRGITKTNHTGRNETSMQATLQAVKETQDQSGLIFVNLIDFDQKYGHRRDPEGYATCVETFDTWIPSLIKEMSSQDLLIISADHGNDPTFHGTDHTRELVPFFIYKKDPTLPKKYLGNFKGFQHISKWVLKYLNLGSDEILRIKSLESTSDLDFIYE